MMRVLYVAIRVLNDLDTCVGSRTLLPSPLSRFVVVVDGIDRKTEADWILGQIYTSGGVCAARLFSPKLTLVSRDCTHYLTFSLCFPIV